MNFKALHSYATLIVNIFLRFSLDILDWFFGRQISILGINGTPAEILISVFMLTIVVRIVFSVNK